MSLLRSEITSYLEAAMPEAESTPISGDASTRLFFRVRSADGRSCVLMDYGDSFEGETDDVRMARIFKEAGLPVAEVLNVCPRAGCLLLEDLGDRSLQSTLINADGRPAPEARMLLERAILLAAQIADRGTAALSRSERRTGPVLDAERLGREMDFFLEHYAHGLLQRTELPRGLREALHGLADRAADSPRRVLCHRDYHSRNLMVLPEGSLAMVDIQDARWGPDTYDLASLLCDAYIDIEESWIHPLIELYRCTLNDSPVEGFRSRLARVSVQRMIKVLGTFGYMITVRGESRYREGIPRTIRRLDRLMPQLNETRRIHELFTQSRLL
jgi:aminoglycoside/choline kinase family phosphotransferase